MSDWLWDIINSIGSGLATSASAALLLYVINLILNRKLTYSIKKVIQKESRITAQMTIGKTGAPNIYKHAGIRIKNPFEISFVVRSVWAQIGEEGNYTRHPMGFIGPEPQEDLMPHKPADSPFGFVTLMPFTNGMWVIKAGDLKNPINNEHFNKICVYVEYLTFFKTPKVLLVEVTKPELLDRLNAMVDQINEGIETQSRNDYVQV